MTKEENSLKAQATDDEWEKITDLVDGLPFRFFGDSGDDEWVGMAEALYSTIAGIKGRQVNGDKPAIRPVIAVPMERTINQHAFFGFTRIALKSRIPFIQLDYTRNDIARNKFAKHLLNSDFTHLIMLDSDHIHPADIADRFVAAVAKYPERQVIGGLNFRRGEPFDPCFFVEGEGDDKSLYTLKEWPDEMFTVAVLGTGSVIIAREVFEKLPQPWFAYIYDGCQDDKWPGVDIYFSKLCKDHGIDLWLEPSITSPHLYDKSVITEEAYRAYLGAHQDKYELIDNEGADNGHRQIEKQEA